MLDLKKPISKEGHYAKRDMLTHQKPTLSSNLTFKLGETLLLIVFDTSQNHVEEKAKPIAQLLNERH